MNKTVLVRKKLLQFVPITLSVLFCLGSIVQAEAAGRPSETPSLGKYLVLVTKSASNKKQKIRLYTDPIRESLCFSVRGPEGNNYKLYVFDMDGKLVCQASAQSGETSTLHSMLKGNYFFEVFSKDELMERGNLTVK